MRLKTYHILGLHLLATTLFGQDSLNLNFEHPNQKWEMDLFEGWRSDYVESDAKMGDRALLIEASNLGGEQQFSSFSQFFPIDLAKDKSLKLSGWVKTENVEQGFAGLYVRVEGMDGVLDFDNMGDRGIRGDTDWMHAMIELEVPKEAKRIAIGGLLAGGGKAWFDAMSVTLDDIDYRDWSSEGKAQKPSVLLKNATYIDVMQGKTIRDQDLKILEGVIDEIGPVGSLENTAGLDTIDVSGKIIMPGLIDAHIHLFQSGGLYTRPDAMNLTGVRSYEEEIDLINDNLEILMKRYLKFGITSIVDVGGPMRNYDYRDEFMDNPFMPNLYMTGPLVSTYLPPIFDIEDPPIVKVESTQEALALVHKQAAENPDFIKIWYIDLPYLSADSSFDMMQAVVKEAHGLGLPVAIHATELNTAKLAIKAGGDYLVHSVSEAIDDEFIQLCLDHDIVLSPSLLVSSNYDLAFSGEKMPSDLEYRMADPFVLGTMFDTKHLQDHPSVMQYMGSKRYWDKANSERDSVQIANLIRLSEAGVKIATGTDAGNIGTLHTASYFSELQAMKTAGMSNAAILKASTVHAAEAAGKESIIGSIAVGKKADLIVLNQNPLDNIGTLEQIHAVIKDGRWIAPDRLLADSPEVLAQKQLNAYNARDIDAFLEPYAEDVKIFSFPDTQNPDTEGKEAMRNGYRGMFENTPDLHCELVNRIVLGNTVIDQEKVIFKKGNKPFEAIAIYKIKDGKISEVYFMR